MKKQIAIALLCLLLLAGCGKKLDNIPSRELILQQGAQWAEEKLAGYSTENLREIWGEPDGTLSGMWGEVWYVDEEHNARVTVYYNADGKAERVLVDTAPGLEPTTESVPEPVPEPDRYDYEMLDSPPKLKVICGGEYIEAAGCGFTWVTEHGIICADAPHPSQMREQLTALETGEGYAVLEFEIPPEEYLVRAWDLDCAPECDGLSLPVSVTGGVIDLLPGGYIYEVVAGWGDGETAGGTALYAFSVVRSA